MIDFDKPNPFSLLRLATSASDEQIVRRGEEESDLTTDEEHRRLVTWAVEALITHPRTRALYELFEMPDTDYDEGDRCARFFARHRRNPARMTDGEQSPAAAVAAFDIAALLDALVDDLQRVPEPDIARALAVAPVTPSTGPLPLEVWDVPFG